MIKYKDLPEQEKLKIFELAVRYRGLYPREDYQWTKIIPSGSDLYHPERWKNGHWSWFEGIVEERLRNGLR